MTPAGGRRVVLLHGLWMPGAAMHWLSVQLRDQGFAPEIFSYHSVADGPDQAIARLMDLLQAEAARRAIRICTLGPCTAAIARERWLRAVGPCEMHRPAVFRSA